MGVVGAGGGSSCAAGRGAADVPGDSATVGLVSCRGGGGSGVSGDRDWTLILMEELLQDALE